MIPRRWLILVALGSGLLAGGTFYLATQQGGVVVAARDVDIPHPLTADDVEIRSMSAALIPDDAARRIEDVIGLVPRSTLLRGQLIFTRSLGEGRPSSLRPHAPVNGHGGAHAAWLPARRPAASRRASPRWR